MLVYGDRNGDIVPITKVERGLSCNYVGPAQRSRIKPLIHRHNSYFSTGLFAARKAVRVCNISSRTASVSGV